MRTLHFSGPPNPQSEISLHVPATPAAWYYKRSFRPPGVLENGAEWFRTKDDRCCQAASVVKSTPNKPMAPRRARGLWTRRRSYLADLRTSPNVGNENRGKDRISFSLIFSGRFSQSKA